MLSSLFIIISLIFLFHVIACAFEYQGTRCRRKFLSNEDRKAILISCCNIAMMGNWKEGLQKKVTSFYSVCPNVIRGFGREQMS